MNADQLLALLRKYIDFVGHEEGVTFIDRLDTPQLYPQFSAEEIALLKKLDAEAQL